MYCALFTADLYISTLYYLLLLLLLVYNYFSTYLYLLKFRRFCTLRSSIGTVFFRLVPLAWANYFFIICALSSIGFHLVVRGVLQKWLKAKPRPFFSKPATFLVREVKQLIFLRKIHMVFGKMHKARTIKIVIKNDILY